MGTRATEAPTRHQRRGERRTTVSVCLTERDVWLLDALARMRFLTTGQLLRLGFGQSRSAVTKRLRQLFDAGFLRVWLRSLESENLYTLTRAGRSALARNGGPAAADVPRALDRDLDHTLAVNDVRVAVATTLPALGAELASWQSDWDLRPHRAPRYIPDGRFAVRWRDASQTIFNLEVDRNSKSPAAFLRKLLAYRAAAYRHTLLGADSATTVLAVIHGPSMLARYEGQVQCARLNLAVWFALLDDAVAHGATGAIWHAPGSGKQLRLPDLATLPSRSEPLAQKTAVLPGTSPLTRARIPHQETA